MFQNGRKTIGVFISLVYDEFQVLLSKGISIRAQELGYNVVFLTNFGGYDVSEYDQGELKIADLPLYEELDGIIMVPDTMAVEGLVEKINGQIRKRSKCPVVSIRTETEGHYNVLVDDDTVLENIIRHFIEVHGFTKLNFLAGPKDHIDSIKRLGSYKRILKEYNIPIEEERIYYGDFWKHEGKTAVDLWLSNPDTVPEAIICANDYMAITVAGALEDRGISVPDMIAVSGFDDISDASELRPSITTATMPVVDMGIEAVNKIDRVNKGHNEEKTSFVKSNTIIRESCGCHYNADKEKRQGSKHYFSYLEKLKREVVRNCYMSADLTGKTKQEDVFNSIHTYVYENAGFTDFYMCLYSDWQNIDDNYERIFDPDEEMVMEVGVKNHTHYNRIRYKRRNLIPQQFEEDRPMIFYVTVLHHRNMDFGYVAIAFEKIQTYMTTFQSWMMNVSNALENIRVHSELNRLVYKLEDMYIRDELTGLYNRRGLETIGEKYLKQAVEEQTALMIFTSDMDKLKFINDNYGHIGGDIALKTVADVLVLSADDDKICVRFGGDEFVVVGLLYDEDKAQRFIRRFIGELEKFNESGNQEFKVYVSYGWDLITPNERTTIEECLVTADIKMYQQKNMKKELHLNTNIIE